LREHCSVRSFKYVSASFLRAFVSVSSVVFVPRLFSVSANSEVFVEIWSFSVEIFSSIFVFAFV